MGKVLIQLNHEKPVVRKRATNALGNLAFVLSDPLLNRLTETLLNHVFLSIINFFGWLGT